MVIRGFFSSRLKASSVQGSRVCQFKARGFASSRLKAQGDSRILAQGVRLEHR